MKTSMASVTLANRELKNRATGIDVYVPRHENITGPLGGSVVYAVIVVTRLFYFKTQGKHKESDVVQFMIRHKYGNFEELHHKLEQKYASVVFPPLPKKTLLVSDAVVNERRRIMETVLQQIARTPKLACSSLVLEFLGAKRMGQGELEPPDKYTPDKEVEHKEEEEDVDLFATSRQTEVRQEEPEEADEDLHSFATNVQTEVTPRKGSSLFELDDDGKDDDIDGLFIPKGALVKNKANIVVDDEDNTELLNIKDDLDELLKVNKPKKPAKPQKPEKPNPKPKPKLKPKPELKPKPSPKSTFEEASVDDDIFKTTSLKTKAEKAVVGQSKGQDEDLFAQARKQSFRKPAHEEDTLDDIFKSPPKQIFSGADDDEDLFREAVSSTMTADDISSYIQQNTLDSESNLDLF